MRIPSFLLIPVALALSWSAAPASARYIEHWMSSAEIARDRPKSVAPRESKKNPPQTEVTTADDDPIAAFARKPVRR
jgi:hypothetical protein